MTQSIQEAHNTLRTAMDLVLATIPTRAYSWPRVADHLEVAMNHLNMSLETLGMAASILSQHEGETDEDQDLLDPSKDS